ncbi:MAG: acetate--CoA ligase [bacterium]
MSEVLKESSLNFWEKQAQNLPWFKKWNRVLEWNEPLSHWFVGGQINASYACLDIHIQNGLQDKIAIIWESENGNAQNLTYGQLYDSVNKFAYFLQAQGVKKGDIVIIYLPMIPEAIAAMLGVARLGATHSVVFSGFNTTALKDRIIDTKAKFVITTDAAFYRNKNITPKNVVSEAISQIGLTTQEYVKKVIVIKRTEHPISLTPGLDVIYDPKTSSIQQEDSQQEFGQLGHRQTQDNQSGYTEPEFVPAVPVESNHPLFILYTSGTTGKPKGIVHSTGGYLTYVYSTIKWAFDISKDSIYWCTADIGWITGHSYVVYGPLMHGAAIYIREGAPDYPTQDAWWQAIAKHKISIFYTSPTALRMFMKMGNENILKYNLSSLKVLGSVGEPINPEVWRWFNDLIGQKRCPIIDTWWQTETGGFMISPAAGLDLVKLKPGSATFALPEIDADIVDTEGQSVPSQTKGFLVIKKPWPGMAIGIHNNPDAFREIYWSKFPGMYYSGDYAIRDAENYFWLLGRADEVLKISGHRIGTSEIESITLEHEAIAETAVIGIPDEIRGEAIIIFSILKTSFTLDIKNANGKHEVLKHEVFKQEILQKIRTQIGAFATPKEIHFVESLPKTRSGKIMRRLLKAVIQGQAIGDLSTLEDGTSIEEIQAIYNVFKERLG